MLKIMKSVPVLNYTGTRGSGPIMPLGTQHARIARLELTDDSVNNPFNPEDTTPEKERGYHDCYPCLAIQFTNKAGGLTERYYFFGFKKYAQLTESEKAATTTFGGKTVPLYTQDLATGYAVTFAINPETGKKIPIETGEIDAAGKKVVIPALERVIDPEKSATAQRIFNDLLVACRIPASADNKIDLDSAFTSLKAFTGEIELTVIEDTYEGKSRHRVTNPRLVATAVPVEESANAAPAIREEGDF